MKQLPATNWLRRNPAIGDHLAGGDAGLADLLLHPQDRAYTVPELVELVRGAGLEIAAFIEPWRYDPASYLTDPSLLHRLERLDPIARAAFAEQLAGNLKRHIVYLVRKERAGGSVARPDDGMVPVLRAGSGALVDSLKGRSNLKVSIDGLEVRLQIPPHSAEILGAIDGKRSIADVHQAISGTVEALKSRNAFKPALRPRLPDLQQIEPAVPDARRGLAKDETHTLPFFSITSTRAAPTGCATCSSPGSAWQISPARIVWRWSRPSRR